MRNNFLLILFFFCLTNLFNVAKGQNKNSIEIKANQIITNNETKITEAIGNVSVTYEKIITIKSEKILYNQLEEKILSNNFTTITHDKKGKLTSNEIIYEVANGKLILKNEVTYVDLKDNKFYFDKIIADENLNEIIGFNFATELVSENKKSNQRIYGKEVIIKENISIIKDGTFTTCNEKNDKEFCLNWKIKAKEILHDKVKRTITFKNALLDLNSIPVLYVPRFSYPDPSVTRKSGFLSPSYSSLGDVGSRIGVPYFFDISNSTDFTITPYYYTKNHPLFIGEFRKKIKDGDLSLENGFTQGYKKTDNIKTDGSRHHLYGNINQNLKNKILDEDNLNIKLQRVNNPTYLRVNKINSTKDGFKRNLVKETDNQLSNEISTISTSNNKMLLFKTGAYQNISKDKKNDQYEYIYPEINYSQYSLLSEKFDDFSLNTIFRSENKNTNQNKTLLVNNFYLNSNSYINENIGTSYKFLGQLNNVNYNSNFNDPKRSDYQLNPVAALDTTYPLYKKIDDLQNIISPRLMLRYAPGSLKNIKTEKIFLDSDNIFLLNRLNKDDLVEKNLSATLGINWSLNNDLLNEKGLKSNLSMAQIFKNKKDEDLPTSSSLNKKVSDVVSGISISEKKNFDINLKNSTNNSFTNFYSTDINLKKIFYKNDISLNYNVKNSHIGNEKNIKGSINLIPYNNLKFNLNSERDLDNEKFKKNSLSLSYENECIRYSLSLNKNYSIDKDLKRNTEIFFAITLLPIGVNLNIPTN